MNACWDAWLYRKVIQMVDKARLAEMRKQVRDMRQKKRDEKEYAKLKEELEADTVKGKLKKGLKSIGEWLN